MAPLREADSAGLVEACDLLFLGAHVIDPESGLSGTANVGVTGSTISHVGPAHPIAATTIQASGLLLVPGFIDVHSHAQSKVGARLQSLDGVTTAVDLEAGALSVADAVRRHQLEGRVINSGFSASWSLARAHVLAGVPLESAQVSSDRTPTSFELLRTAQRIPEVGSRANGVQLGQILELVQRGVSEGGLAIGGLLGYHPGVGRDELVEIGRLARHLNVPLVLHSRFENEEEPESGIEGMLELIGVAAGTGAHVHVCHLNSSFGRRLPDAIKMLSSAIEQGIEITTEAYPFSTYSTVIDAPFLDPVQVFRAGKTTPRIYHIESDAYVETATQLKALRASSPGSICTVEYLDEASPADQKLLAAALRFDRSVISSDAMPLESIGPAPQHTELTDRWPIPPHAYTHPRSYSTYSTLLSRFARDRGVLSIDDAVRRSTLEPANILGRAAPSMRTKGRIQVGCDADITVMSLPALRAESTLGTIAPASGIEHVMVGGQLVVDSGEPVFGRAPGKPIVSRLAPEV